MKRCIYCDSDLDELDLQVDEDICIRCYNRNYGFDYVDNDEDY